MTKRKLFCSILLLSCRLIYGQDVSTDFFDRNNKKTNQEGSYYYSTGKKVLFVDKLVGGIYDTTESYVDTVISYYTASNTIKSRKIYNADGILQGLFLTYHENGKPQTKTTFFNGKPIGFFMSWYPNGNPQKVIQYFNDKGRISDWEPLDFKIVNYWDSLGNPVVVNGNGICDCYLTDDVFFREKGKVSNGVRDSVWLGFAKDTLVFRETYESGKFIAGARLDMGQKLDYITYESFAEYDGGKEGMLKHLVKTLKYPALPRRLGIEGQLFVEFIVEKDGSLTDIKITKGIHPDLDREAIRVVTLMPHWIPSKQRGKPFRSKSSVPIKFKLAH